MLPARFAPAASGFGPSAPMALPISGIAALRRTESPALSASARLAGAAATVQTEPVIEQVARRTVAHPTVA